MGLIYNGFVVILFIFVFGYSSVLGLFSVFFVFLLMFIGVFIVMEIFVLLIGVFGDFMYGILNWVIEWEVEDV